MRVIILRITLSQRTNPNFNPHQQTLIVTLNCKSTSRCTEKSTRILKKATNLYIFHKIHTRQNKATHDSCVMQHLLNQKANYFRDNNQKGNALPSFRRISRRILFFRRARRLRWLSVGRVSLLVECEMRRLVKWLRNEVVGLRGQLVFGNGVGAEEECDLISYELGFVSEAQP